MNIKDYCEKKGLRVYTLARVMGVSPATLYRAVNGKHILSVRIAKKLEEFTEGEITKEEALWPDFYQQNKNREKHYVRSIF